MEGMKTLGDSVMVDSMIDLLMVEIMKDSLKGSKGSKDSLKVDSLKVDSLKVDSLMVDSMMVEIMKDSLKVSIRMDSSPLDSPFHSSSVLPASRN